LSFRACIFKHARGAVLTQIFVERCVDFEVAHLSVLMVWRLPYPKVPPLIILWTIAATESIVLCGPGPCGSRAWESSCILTLQNRGLLLAGTILILGTQMLPSLHQYYMIVCPPTAAKLLYTASSHLTLHLGLKKKGNRF